MYMSNKDAFHIKDLGPRAKACLSGQPLGDVFEGQDLRDLHRAWQHRPFHAVERQRRSLQVRDSWMDSVRKKKPMGWEEVPKVLGTCHFTKPSKNESVCFAVAGPT